MFTRIHLIFLFFSFFFFHCSDKKNSGVEISDNVVLKIGSAEVTQYEMDKNRPYDPEKANAMIKEKWVNQTIDNTYLLADALDQRYDTLSSINYTVEYAAKSMISRIDGYLWNNQILPTLNISDEVIKTAYKKRNTIYTIEFVVFPEENVLKAYNNGNSTVKNATEFADLIRNTEDNKNIFYYTKQMQWPLEAELMEYCDEILGMDINEVSNFNINNRLFVLHMVKKENINQQPFENEKEILEFIVKDYTSYKIASSKQNEVRGKALPTIHREYLDTIYSVLNNTKYQQKDYDSLLNMDSVIMNYIFKGEKRDYTIRQLVHYYKNCPFLLVTNDSEYLYNLLNDIVLQEYLYYEADSIGLTKNDKKYVLDRRNFKNRVILSNYEENEFYNKAGKVSDEEALEHYNANVSSYKDGQKSKISLFTFRDKESCWRNLEYINTMIKNGETHNLCDSVLIIGLVKCDTSITIDFDSTSFLSNSVKQSIFDMADLSLSQNPLENNGTHILVYKVEEYGERTKPFEEVKETIKQNIFTKKYNALKDEKLKQLKDKYTIALNKINE